MGYKILLVEDEIRMQEIIKDYFNARQIEEIKDREIYRRMYLDKFKAQVKAHLDNIEIVDEKDFKN